MAMKGMKYESTFDSQNKSAHIYLKQNVSIKTVKKVDAEVYCDYDNNNSLVGIEVLMTNNEVHNNEHDHSEDLDEEMTERAENYSEGMRETFD